MTAHPDPLPEVERWPFGPYQAARLIASVSWPNERGENRDAWAVKMLDDRRDLLATEIPRARARLESAIRAVLDYPPEPQRAEPCPTPGCPGDSRYAAPGRNHLTTCAYPLDITDQRADLRTVAALPGHPDPAELVEWHVRAAEAARERVVES